jgi:hypothetical protein
MSLFQQVEWSLQQRDCSGFAPDSLLIRKSEQASETILRAKVIQSDKFLTPRLKYFSYPKKLSISPAQETYSFPSKNIGFSDGKRKFSKEETLKPSKYPPKYV